MLEAYSPFVQDNILLTHLVLTLCTYIKHYKIAVIFLVHLSNTMNYFSQNTPTELKICRNKFSLLSMPVDFLGTINQIKEWDIYTGLELQLTSFIFL
jgi:hypothetical protein